MVSKRVVLLALYSNRLRAAQACAFVSSVVVFCQGPYVIARLGVHEQHKNDRFALYLLARAGDNSFNQPSV